MQNKKAVIMGASAVILLAALVATYVVLEGNPFANAPYTPVVSKKSPVPKKVKTSPSTTPQKEVVPYVWPEDAQGSIKALNEKQKKLEALKLDVAIETEEKRLKELQQEVPKIQELPVFNQATLEAMSPTISPLPVEKTTVFKTELISIYGVDDKYTAIFAISPTEKKHLTIGDRFLEGKIKSINLNTVVLTNGKRFTVERSYE